MNFPFMPITRVSLLSLSGCIHPNQVTPIPDTNAPVGNPVLRIVTNVDCALFSGNSDGLIGLKIENICTLGSEEGSAQAYVDIAGNRTTSTIPAIAAGGSDDVFVQRPSVPPGDLTGGVGIANQGPLRSLVLAKI